MEDVIFTAAQTNKTNRNKIAVFLAILAGMDFTSTELEQIFTVLEESFDEFVGELYTEAPEITFVGGSGDSAAATAVLTGGIVTSIIITDPGEGYSSAPEIIFSDEFGNGAAAVAVLSSGDTVASATVIHQSLVAKLVARKLELEEEFEAL